MNALAFRAGYTAPDDLEAFRKDRGRHERDTASSHSWSERVQRRQGRPDAFVQVVGNEVAAHNVQLNAIGPAHIANNMYYTSEMLEDEDVRGQFVSEIPAGRIGEG